MLQKAPQHSLYLTSISFVLPQVESSRLELETSYKLPPKVADALIRLVDITDLNKVKADGASIVDNLGTTLEITLEYITSINASTDGLPQGVQVIMDNLTHRLQEQIESSSTSSKPKQRHLLSQPTLSSAKQDGGNSFEQQQQQKSHHRFSNNFHPHPKHTHYFDIPDAAHRGDKHYLKHMVSSYLNHPSIERHIHDQHNRRASVVSRQEQCEQLVKCAEGLTLYDIVLFFYRDNIDFNKGEFDDGAIRNFDEGFFDEATLLDKASRIFTKAGNARTSNFDDNSCNDLLQEFHQVIETGENLFVWKGGVVTDVCLASGSVEYLGLESIAQNVSKTVADFIFEDVLLCSRQLFDTNDRGETDFVFVDPVSNTLRLPTGIKGDLVGATPNTPTFENRDRHGKPMSYEPTDYFTFRSISEGGYCDSLFLFAN